jgi:hypothetical protein
MHADDVRYLRYSRGRGKGYLRYMYMYTHIL